MDTYASHGSAARMLRIGLIALFVLAISGYWLWQGAAQRRAVLRLPAEQRQRAVSSTLHVLDTLCAGDIDTALGSYCEDQAQFVLQFPECDRGCRERAEALTAHHPAR
ncbi:MAG: hypothetical protein JWM53_5031 [bacterium]|nr:hypothetical protein [bacterium]